MNLPTRPIICTMLFFMLILLGLIVFSDNGLAELNRLHKEKERIARQNLILSKKNYRLYRTIQRLKSDPAFVEHIARKELGMVGTHQIIFKFSGTRKGR